LQALRRQGNSVEAFVYLWQSVQAWSGKDAALERAGNMLQRLAVAFKFFNAPLRSEVGHRRPQFGRRKLVLAPLAAGFVWATNPPELGRLLDSSTKFRRNRCFA